MSNVASLESFSFWNLDFLRDHGDCGGGMSSATPASDSSNCMSGISELSVMAANIDLYGHSFKATGKLLNMAQTSSKHNTASSHASMAKQATHSIDQHANQQHDIAPAYNDFNVSVASNINRTKAGPQSEAEATVCIRRSPQGSGRNLNTK